MPAWLEVKNYPNQKLQILKKLKNFVKKKLKKIKIRKRLIGEFKLELSHNYVGRKRQN